MRILIASDKFKGSLSAAEACEAIAAGLAKADSGKITINRIPIADGGEGIARAITEAKDGEWCEIDSVDALGRPIRAGYGWIPSESLAVVEMAETSGLWQIDETERDPWRASTFGTGLLVRHAVEQQGSREILIGIGGSATNDGGTGMASALGIRFLDAEGTELDELPATLEEAERIDRDRAISLPRIRVACDVTNPLLGEKGCTRVYGPQKGIAETDFKRHEHRLEHLVRLTGSSGASAAEVAGAGAAGGLGFGCLAFLGAELKPGFDLVADLLGLESAVERADVVITGEGRLDRQTLQGKGPAGVAALARKHEKPVFAFAGCVEEGAEEALATVFEAVFPIAPPDVSTEESMVRGAEFLSASAARNADIVFEASPLRG